MAAFSEALLDWLAGRGARIAAVVVLALILTRIARLAVRRIRGRLEGAADVTSEMALRRTATLAGVLTGAVRVLIWAVALLLVLDQFGFNLAPLLAGAGIAGVAIGFGAQSLVRDFLAGFFLLLENQLEVGNVADVQTPGGLVSGRVEAITLRTVSIRAFDGTLSLVPNGNIEVIGNKSRGWARAIVDVQVSRDENIERVRGVLEDLFAELDRDPAFRGGLFSPPTVLGVETLGDYQVVVRVVAETRPSRRWDVERELRKRIKQRLDDRGVGVPLAPLVITAQRPERDRGA